MKPLDPAVALTLMLLAAGCIPDNTAPDPSIAGELVRLHNQERGRQGLPPYQWDSRLQAAAQAHADRMATVDTMGHSGIGDGNHLERTQAAGYPGWDVRENIAGNATDAAQAVDLWMHSGAHRAAILSRRCTDMGAAVGVTRDGRNYWCAVFGNPTPLQ
jgi:uncharacterized protein YkwD